MTYVSTLLLSVLITITLVPLLGRLAIRYQLVDVPNARKVHQQPIPRCGGIAMALGALVPVLSLSHAGGFVPAFLAGAGVECRARGRILLECTNFGAVRASKDYRRRGPGARGPHPAEGEGDIGESNELRGDKKEK